VQVLTPSLDLASFFHHIGRAPGRLLRLDYDGTLAPFHVEPERAVPYPQVAGVLRKIVAAGGTRVVIVSGRPADQLPPLLGLEDVPEVWGSHGWERLLPDGRRVVEKPHVDALRRLETAAAAIASVLPDGAKLERKLASLALHWRGLPQAQAADLERRARELWEPVGREGGVEMLPFDGGLELRTMGRNKHDAVKAVLSETAPESAIAYLGDDLTDEDAFRAVKTRGVGVLVRPQCRETAADVWLRPPDELVDFLQRWAVERH
jgi:trehalose 6-phosphate phosphatase